MMEIEKSGVNQIAIQNKTFDLSTRYGEMLSDISANYPMIEKATMNFNKKQSQFMDSMLTVSHPTELRNARQILAEINKSRMALNEAYFGIRKKKIEIKKKMLALPKAEGLDAEMLEVEISELESQCSTTVGYVEGAIRKIKAYMSQYQNILHSLGKKEFTEEDFEKDEENYHIMKMFEQGLCAARSRGGMMDEGNQIYAHQIGINGTVAQIEITSYLKAEELVIANGRFPAHEMTIKWLNCMAKKYAGSAKRYAELKGMKLLDPEALHRGGN